MKRYEFTGETKTAYGRTLHQIRALVQIGAVAAGALGGWIESETILPHDGDGWVYENAACLGKAVIRGGEIRGGVIWGGEIRGGVIWGGEIRGGVIWGGEIRGGVIRGGVIWGGVIWGGVIWGGVIWGGEIRGGVIRGGEIRGGVKDFTPIAILGLRWTVTICDSVMTIGCQSHEIKKWFKFKDKTIGEMDGGALEFWSKNKALIFSMIDDSGREYK